MLLLVARQRPDDLIGGRQPPVAAGSASGRSGPPAPMLRFQSARTLQPEMTVTWWAAGSYRRPPAQSTGARRYTGRSGPPPGSGGRTACRAEAGTSRTGALNRHRSQPACRRAARPGGTRSHALRGIVACASWRSREHIVLRYNCLVEPDLHPTTLGNSPARFAAAGVLRVWITATKEEAPCLPKNP